MTFLVVYGSEHIISNVSKHKLQKQISQNNQLVGYIRLKINLGQRFTLLFNPICCYSVYSTSDSKQFSHSDNFPFEIDHGRCAALSGASR